MTIDTLIKKARIHKDAKIALSNILVDDDNKEPDIITDKGIMDVLPLRITQNRHTKQVLHYLKVSKHSNNKYISKPVNKEIMGLVTSNLPYRLYLIDGLVRHYQSDTFFNMVDYFKQRYNDAPDKASFKDSLRTIALESIGEENNPDGQIGSFLLSITKTFNSYFIKAGLINFNHKTDANEITKLGKQVINTPDSKIDKYCKNISYHPLIPYSTVIKRLIKAFKAGVDSQFDILIGLTFAFQLFDIDINNGISCIKINGNVYKSLSFITSILITLNLFTNIAQGTPIKADDSALDAVNNTIEQLPFAYNARQQVIRVNKLIRIYKKGGY